MSTWIDEREDPVSAVGVAEGEHHGNEQERDGDLRQRGQGHATHEEDTEGDAAEDHGGSHVRLLDDECGRHDQHAHDRSDHLLGRYRTVHPSDNDVGGKGDQGQLHQFGGLKAEHSEPDPPRRTARSDAKPGNEDGHEEKERASGEWDRPGAPLAVVDPGEEEEGPDTHDHPEDLSEEDRPWRVVRDQRHHGRCRSHHH